MTRHNIVVPGARLSKPPPVADAMMEPERSKLDPDTMRIIIDTVREDISDLCQFYSINFSVTRITRLKLYCKEAAMDLFALPFDDLDAQGQADYVLLRKYLKQQLRGLQAFEVQHQELSPVIEPFAGPLVELIEKRQTVTPMDWQQAAGVLSTTLAQIRSKRIAIQDGSIMMNSAKDRFAAYRAANVVLELRSHLQEYFEFYNGYDPMATWWLSAPYKELHRSLEDYANLVREKLVGIAPGDEEEIVGQPIGRDGILEALESAVVAFTPEECIRIAEKEYAWCEAEMIQASTEVGYGKDWKKALEHVKNMYVAPGEQTQLVHKLSREAVDYVRKHDLVTIPRVAEEAWQTTMMTPERQRVNPFFLGGTKIIVSYPTDTMSHEDKLMSMRGNAIPFSRSTVFHELLPGHHLQYHYIKRYRTYRRLFETALWIEGWAFAWEMNLYARGFPGTAENKIGMLFWRMHRCARIVFSLSFHLGKFTPQECIDYLVDKVGHEYATAEGEVRRSFNGDYGALYQAAYMLGALQFRTLRKEMVEEGGMHEREFHDRILKEGPVPVEVLRAILQGKKLEEDHTASWQFYDL